MDSSLSEYLMNIAAEHPFSLQIDVLAAHISIELEKNWPQGLSTDPLSGELRQYILRLLSPLISDAGEEANLRLVINASEKPDIKLLFSDAPALCATLDAMSGVVRSSLVSAHLGQQPLEGVELGLTCLCQPIKGKNDQWPQGLGQGANLFRLTDVELKELSRQADDAKPKLERPEVAPPVVPPPEPAPK